MKIEHTLNKAQARQLFEDKALMIGCADVIFDCKIAELFGEDIRAWAEACMGGDFIRPAADWNCWGDGKGRYFYRSGFNKIVSQHNYLLCLRQTGAEPLPPFA